MTRHQFNRSTGSRPSGLLLDPRPCGQPPAFLRIQRVDARQRHGQQRPDFQTGQPHPDPPDVQLRVDAAPCARARRVQLEGLVRPGAEARRRADLALGVRRRHDGARAGDVAREEQRENARLNSDLEDDRAAKPTMSSGSTFPKTTSQTMSQTHTATSATAAR